MKKILFLLALLFPVAAHAQTAAYSGFCDQGATSATTSGLSSTNKLQGIIPYCTVEVFLTGTLTHATIYKDALNTPQTNPYRTTVNGQITFYAATGQGYDIVKSGGISPLVYTTPLTVTDWQSGGGGGSGTSVWSPDGSLTIAPHTGTILAQCTPASNSQLGCVETDGTTTTIVGGKLVASGGGGGGGVSIEATSPILVNGGAGPVGSGTATISCPTCGGGGGGGTFTVIPVSGVTTYAPPVIGTPPGQYIAWAFPTLYCQTPQVTIHPLCPGVPGANAQNIGFVDYADTVWGTWSGFTVPTLPSGAVVQSSQGYVVSSCSNCFGPERGELPTPTGYPVGNFLPTLIPVPALYPPSSSIGVEAGDSKPFLILPQGVGYYDVSFVGIAIIYTAPSTPSTVCSAGVNVGNIYTDASGGSYVCSYIGDGPWQWNPIPSSTPAAGTVLSCIDASGSGTAQSCDTYPSYTPVAGSAIIYSSSTGNTGTGLTIDVNGLGAKPVAKYQSNTTLVVGDIGINAQVLMTYDGTNWEMATPGNTVTAVAVNGGSSLGSLNLNAATPSADSGYVALTPKITGANAIIEAPLGSSGAPGLLQCGSGLTCSGGVANASGGGGGGGVQYPAAGMLHIFFGDSRFMLGYQWGTSPPIPAGYVQDQDSGNLPMQYAKSPAAMRGQAPVVFTISGCSDNGTVATITGTGTLPVVNQVVELKGMTSTNCAPLNSVTSENLYNVSAVGSGSFSFPFVTTSFSLTADTGTATEWGLVVNLSIGAEHAASAVGDYTTYVHTLAASAGQNCTLYDDLAGNDILDGTANSTIEGYLHSIWTEERADCPTIVRYTILPGQSAWCGGLACYTQITGLNQWTSTQTKSVVLPVTPAATDYVDLLVPYDLAFPNNDNQVYYQVDNLHPRANLNRAGAGMGSDALVLQTDRTTGAFDPTAPSAQLPSTATGNYWNGFQTVTGSVARGLVTINDTYSGPSVPLILQGAFSADSTLYIGSNLSVPYEGADFYWHYVGFDNPANAACIAVDGYYLGPLPALCIDGTGAVYMPGIAPSSSGPNCLQIAATTGLISQTGSPCGSSGSGTGFNGGAGTSYQDAQEIAAPANPASTYDRLYLDSTAHQLKCLTSSGGSCMPSGGGTVTTSGSPVSPNIAAFSGSTAITAATSANIQTAIGAGVYDASGAAAARQANLSLLPGTYTDGDMCTYTASGTRLECNTAIPSVGTWGALNYPTWALGTPFVKMTAAGTFALDTNTYLTSLPSTVVQTNQSNSFGAYLQDFSNATQIKLPIASGYTSAANGEIGYDSAGNNWHGWLNGADMFLGLIPKTGITNNHCVQFAVAGGVVSLSDAGGTCTTGGSMVWPTTAGIVYWTSGTGWGGAYNASTPIPANYLPTDLSSSSSVNGTSIPASATLCIVSSLCTGYQAALTDPVTGPGSGVTVGHIAIFGNTSGTTVTDGGPVPTGSGTVSSGTEGQIAWYDATGTEVEGGGAGVINSLLQGGTGCNTAGYVYSPQSGTCAAPAGGTNVKVNGGTALTTENQVGLLPYLCADTSGSGTTQSCTTTPSFTPQVGNCLVYTTTTPNSSTSLTLNVNGSGPLTVQIPSASGWTGVSAAGQIPYNTPLTICYSENVDSVFMWNVQQTGTVSSGGSSPLTTKGDLYGYSTTNTSIPVGTDGQVLTADSTQATGVKWVSPSGGGGAVPVYSGYVAPLTIGTLYLTFGSGVYAVSESGLTQYTVSTGGLISSLNVAVSGPTDPGSSAVVTMRVNSADSTLTCTVAATTDSCSDLTHTVTVAAGDFVDYRFVFSGSITGTPDYFVSTAWGGSSGGGPTSGSPLYPAPSLTAGTSSFNNYTFFMRLHGTQFASLPASGGWNVALYTLSGIETVVNAAILRTTPFSTTVIDSTPVTFITNGSTISGLVYSDAIPLAIDRTHDYVLAVYVSASADVLGTCTGGAESYQAYGDHTTDTTLGSVTGNTQCNFYGAYVF